MLPVGCTSSSDPQPDAGQDTGPDFGTTYDQGFADVGTTTDLGTDVDLGAPDQGPRPDLGTGGEGICSTQACLTRIDSDADWAAISRPVRGSTRCEIDQETVFILPKASAPFQQTLFVDMNGHPHIYDFLKTALSAELPNLDPVTFQEMFVRSDTRQFYVGRIFRIAQNDSITKLAFELDTQGFEGNVIEPSVVREIHQGLSEALGFPLAMAPNWRSEPQNFPGEIELLMPAPCAEEACANPGAPCLIVPPSTDFCGHFMDNRSMEAELDQRMRLRLVAGSHQLPSSGSAQLSLYEGGMFGPNGDLMTPEGPGTVTITERKGTTTLQFEQTMLAGNVRLPLNFQMSSNQPNPTFHLRGFELASAYMNGIEEGGMTNEEVVQATSCEHGELDQFFAEGSFNGGSFVIEYRHLIPFAGSGPFALVSAQVTLGGQTVNVTDPYSLVYAGVHHNWDNQLVVLFDQPIDFEGAPAYGLWVDEADYTCCPVDGIYTLDSSLAQDRALTVQRYIR